MDEVSLPPTRNSFRPLCIRQKKEWLPSRTSITLFPSNGLIPPVLWPFKHFVNTPKTLDCEELMVLAEEKCNDLDFLYLIKEIKVDDG